MSGVGREFMDWRRAVCESDLPSGTRHVLLVLSLYVPTIGEAAFPSLHVLAVACGLSDNVVRLHLRTAERTGWLIRQERFAENGRQTSNVYLMTAPGMPPRNLVGGSPLNLVPAKKKGSSSTKEERMCEPDMFAGELPPGRVDYSHDFEAVWELHPRGSKKAAFLEYRRALREKRVTEQKLSDALAAYVESFRGDFQGAHLSRWLKEDRWNNSHGKAAGADPCDDLARWKRAAAEPDA